MIYIWPDFNSTLIYNLLKVVKSGVEQAFNVHTWLRGLQHANVPLACAKAKKKNLRTIKYNANKVDIHVHKSKLNTFHFPLTVN